MAKQIKNKKPVSQASKAEIKRIRYLIAFPVIAFVIKLITMGNIQGGGWLGADGENYFKGVDGLYAEGFFSKAEILNYWPAGYPILLWLLVLISVSKFVYIIGFVQTIFFAFATYYFTRNISKTSLAWLAVPTSLLISFNPTLSLSTLAVGYEAPVAACFMMTFGVIIASKLNDHKNQLPYAIYAGGWISLASFMQPRYLLIGLSIFALWGFSFSVKRSGALIAIFAIVFAFSAPALMIFRNYVAVDKPVVSTNLAVAVNYGAGEETSGGYSRTGPFVPCDTNTPSVPLTDNQIIGCVLKWYVGNPTKTAKLIFNKSQFYWSPWSGPLANGTMARNPWLKIAPTKNIEKTQSGAELLTGPIGKTVSWFWIIGQLTLIAYGFLVLQRGDAISRLIGRVSALATLFAWLISVGTIGDHRFRIPTMGLSLLLQATAMWKIKQKVTKAL
jgi:hypothetical protein